MVRENAVINLRSLFILTDSFLFSFDLRLVLVTRITQISEIAIKFFILWNLCDNTCICVQRKCILLFPTWRWKKRKLNWCSVARNETASNKQPNFLREPSIAHTQRRSHLNIHKRSGVDTPALPKSAVLSLSFPRRFLQFFRPFSPTLVLWSSFWWPSQATRLYLPFWFNKQSALLTELCARQVGAFRRRRRRLEVIINQGVLFRFYRYQFRVPNNLYSWAVENKIAT